MPAIFQKKDISGRCALLDFLRGLTVVNMVVFHSMYSWKYVFGFAVPDWFDGLPGFVWQQAICCTFITLSGFCAAMGTHTVRRGAVVFGLGLVITLVTLLFLPEERILFGVLTLLGSAMLLTGAVKPLLQKIPAAAGLPVSFALFALTREVNAGCLGIFFQPLVRLPDWLYHDYVTAFLGFPQPGFISSDYFSLIPWLFLFLSGFWLHGLCGEKILAVRWKGFRPLNCIGRHALLIYILHQPVFCGLGLLLTALTGVYD